MNKYLIVSISQIILLVITYALIPFYIKNSGKFLLGNLSRKAIPVYAVSILFTFVSLGYLIYYCSKNKISDDSDLRNKLFLTLYLFLSSLWSILLIFYGLYKKSRVYYGMKVLIFLIAACAIGLLANISNAYVGDSEEKWAIASASMLTLQSLVGDALVWSWYFPK
jgi:hypothetical protein